MIVNDKFSIRYEMTQKQKLNVIVRTFSKTDTSYSALKGPTIGNGQTIQTKKISDVFTKKKQQQKTQKKYVTHDKRQPLNFS